MSKRVKKTIKLAIFDIDGTIFRSSLIVELFNELVRRGIYSSKAQSEVEHSYLAWLNRSGHYNDYLMKLVRVFYKNIGGCSVRKIEPAVRAVIERQKDRVHRYPRQLLTDTKKNGYFTLVVSNSPETIVKRFAKAAGFAMAIGHTLEIVDGVYTGRCVVDGKFLPGTFPMDKTATLKRFMKDQRLHADLGRSIMIGDSEGDLPLLSYVGRPIAFNPSLKLARIARAKGWPIVVERKDAVYRIRNADLLHVAGQQPKVSYGIVGRKRA